MKRNGSLSLALSVALVACGGANVSEPPASNGTNEAPTTKAVVAAPEASSPTSPAPSPEETKKNEARAALEADRAAWKAKHDAELARWTPELHAEAKALAEKTFPDAKTAVTAALAGKHRVPGNADRDKARHPAGTLDFFGLKPKMTVVEFGPGDGWYTELLAPVLAKEGKLLATSSDPKGPADQRSTFYAQRFAAFLEKAPELYGKVETVVVDDKNPSLGHDGAVDMILVMRQLHGMQNAGTLDAWLTEYHKALKPGGVLGIEEHRAKADADPAASAKLGYMPEKYVIERATAAGFKLLGKSEINANPKDTKDYPEGVWTLPPTFRLKDKDHDKYAAIGESDRMTLKFVKLVEPKTAKAPKK